MTPILVDSAWIIDRMREGIDFRQCLLPDLRNGRLYNSGVIRAEVLRGIKQKKIHAEARDFFDIVPEVPCDARLWRTVSELGWSLGRKGQWPPVTDLAIAACAMRIKADLITPDLHFQDIPGLVVRADL